MNTQTAPKFKVGDVIRITSSSVRKEIGEKTAQKRTHVISSIGYSKIMKKPYYYAMAKWQTKELCFFSNTFLWESCIELATKK